MDFVKSVFFRLIVVGVILNGTINRESLKRTKYKEDDFSWKRNYYSGRENLDSLIHLSNENGSQKLLP
jgi:hypothetical protein